jgi:agmatine/peptidylarginine deiminase
MDKELEHWKARYGSPKEAVDVDPEKKISLADYRYNEFSLIGELEDYVNSTYTEHYSKNKFQATEFIIDGGHGEGFCLGNILKYTQRYGNKEGKNRKDLLKVLHYALIALHVHDLEHGTGHDEVDRRV